MKGNGYRKGTYHIGWALITKKVGHKKVRLATKKVIKAES
jgi:hypothetical protein